VWIIPRLAGTHRERIADFPTQLPVELLRRVVARASDPGDVVLDPCCGSATTGAACLELGRRFVGIEMSEKFADLARQRLEGIAAGSPKLS
jgi:site-specific DNA-methyltransferase (adenine-specific)